MKKKILVAILIISVIFISVLGVISIKKEAEIKKETEEKENTLKEIKSHYGDFVITNKETKLYKKQKDEYIESGKINSNIKLELENMELSYDTKYFLIKTLDLYIKYSDVDIIDEYAKSDRYKNYIYFNNNIITNDITSFYDKDNNFIYSINSSFDFKVLVNLENKYGVIYNNELLFIKKSDVVKTYSNNNTDLKNASRVKTLTYHYLYDPSKTTCNQAICLTIEKFESHLKYLKENSYFTLKLEELEWYLSGYLNIPSNSVVLTIDDGTIIDQKSLRLLEEYEANATLFVITGRYPNMDNFQSPNLDLESHTDNMHNAYECSGYGLQGGGILCLPEDNVLKDLKTSQDRLGGSKYFAYPFFDYSNRAINLLKQAGFRLAFIGQHTTDGYSYPLVTDKYKVPRKTIFSTITLNEFISYLK